MTDAERQLAAQLENVAPDQILVAVLQPDGSLLSIVSPSGPPRTFTAEQVDEIINPPAASQPPPAPAAAVDDAAPKRKRKHGN